MKIPYFCCIGAELKRYEKDFDFMNQVYLYKIPADDTIEEVLAQDYFQAIADTVLQDDLLYIYEPTAQVLYTCRFNKQAGHITAVQLANNVPGLTPNRVLISDSTGHITAGDVTLEYLKNKVNLDGTSVMTGPLKFRAGSFSGAIAGGLGDGVSIYKLKADDSIDSEVASLTKTNGFTPGTTNTQNIGSPTLKWKDAHVARVITGIINNGYDIAVPVTNSADTLALKSEVDNAANSGDQLYATGVWYAKMYSASTVPTGAEYDGKNYADFSQTDSGGNPVIKIYTGASGAWTLTETITPPADYNGYMTITSKIWDIAEQAGQQGGKVLWSHNQRTFTPYPQIISFENAALTGIPTAPLPTSDSPNDQIANKEYVDNATANSGSGRNIGDTFMTKRTDTSLAGAVECDGATYNTTDFTGDGSIGELLEAGKLDYVSLSAYSTAISTKGWCDKIGWDGTGNTVFRVPTLNAHIVQTNNIPVVGNGGVLNVGGNGQAFPLYTSGSKTVQTDYYAATLRNLQLNTDPTKSGIIADTSDTAQLRVMIQIADGATDEALETCTQVLADVAALKYDYVVDFQAPTAQNNYTWYRKYKSGWVEQGARYETSSNIENITFPVAFAATPTIVTSGSSTTRTGCQDYQVDVYNLTTTGFTKQYIRSVGTGWGWCAFGMAA